MNEHPLNSAESPNSGTAITRLLSSLRTDDPPVDPRVAAHVIKELRSERREIVLDALAQAIQDPDPDYRCEIANVFLEYDYGLAINHVASLLHNCDDARIYICQRLGSIGRSEAVPLLGDVLLHDADADNRWWAAWALGSIGNESAIPALKHVIEHDAGTDFEGRTIREIAIKALRRISAQS